MKNNLSPSISVPPPKQASKKRRFDADFKRQAVSLAGTIGFAQASADLGVSEGNIRNWAHALQRDGGQAFTPTMLRQDATGELARLREENRILKMERDILKKAAALFAKHPG
jgi:transposase